MFAGMPRGDDKLSFFDKWNLKEGDTAVRAWTWRGRHWGRQGASIWCSVSDDVVLPFNRGCKERDYEHKIAGVVARYCDASVPELEPILEARLYVSDSISCTSLR